MNQMQIPSRALDAQKQAAHPETSVWVSANAGSGKTHVLTERVIRLMLNGSEPSRILCLTYTKAAAAVMKTRIFNRLSRWTTLNDGELSKELEKLEGKRANEKRLNQARRLFAHALETPGGLKIQTIHAFCESLLHQFPLEANIAGHFEMLDDTASQTLIGEARRTLFEKAYLKADAELSDAFYTILTTVGENGLDNLLSEAISKREHVLPFIRKVKQQGVETTLRGLLNVGDETEKELIARLRTVALFPESELDIFEKHGGSNTAEFVANLRELRVSDDAKVEQAASKAYLTKTGDPRSLNRVFTKKLSEVEPNAIEKAEAKQQQILQLLDQLTCLRLLSLNQSAFIVLDALLTRYEALKQARGFLDFDDLIYRTLGLLRRKGAGQWVQYKLDQGIDHVLVDEAQDTSPAQWNIIRALIAEFFTGYGQRDVLRTVFAVGDEKQSIYSFQGAVPKDFAENGRIIKKQALQATRDFDNIRLDFSFRSTKEVLSSVDIVFAEEKNYRGLSADNEKTVHEAIRHDPGEVDIWDMIVPETINEPEDWRAPVDEASAPAVQLAELIAQTIHDWIKNGEPVCDKGEWRAVKTSDILVLVRKRDQFVPSLARALKNKNVPVAGADRLHLTQHIAIRDLMALGRFILQPQDDLSLASLFKSPLFGLTEDDLYLIAENRTGSLWQMLEKSAETDMRFQPIYNALSRYRRMADTVPAFELYSTILSEDGGRRKILARLGAEASDVLDAFLDTCLTIQKTGLPGLQAFLATLEMSAPEIKRELDQDREEVRIMTVHAAKGLEGKIVFLVDSGSALWNARHEPKLLSVSYRTQLGEEEAILWVPQKEFKSNFVNDYIAALKIQAEDEYRRLLYVGMTRAEDRLILCGYRSSRVVDGTWNTLVQNALTPHIDAKETYPLTENIQAWRYALHDNKAQSGKAVVKDDISKPPLPAFFKQKMAPEPILPKPLSASHAGLEIDKDDETVEGQKTLSPVLAPVLGEKVEQKDLSRSFAIQRGIMMHQLIQYLPDIEAQHREAMIDAYLERNTSEWTKAQRDDVKASLVKLLSSPQTARVFSPNSQAEISLQGKIVWEGKERDVVGQIDRLVIENDKILIVDFKTGYVPKLDDIQNVYINQMALYRALLLPLYPKKTIEAALIYTDGPVVYLLDNTRLDKAMADIFKNTK